MIVVSDTSPVRGLANLGLLELLRDIYGEVIIPEAVAAELRNPPPGQDIVELASYPFVRVQAPSLSRNQSVFLDELDRGEAEAIVLALELGSDLILMDESAGRRRAKRLGLEIIGVLGVLLEAKKLGFVESVTPLMDQLREDHRFFIGAKLRSEVIRRAGESLEF
jgi:predicted nucleic acid-binding protein